MGKVYLKSHPTGSELHSKASTIIIVEGALYVLDENEDVVQIFASGSWEVLSLDDQ